MSYVSLVMLPVYRIKQFVNSCLQSKYNSYYNIWWRKILQSKNSYYVSRAIVGLQSHCGAWGLEKESTESIEQTGESISIKGGETSGFFHHFSIEKALFFILFLISLETLLVFCLNSTLLYKIMFDSLKMSTLSVTLTFIYFCLYWHYIQFIVEYWIILPLTYLSNICHYLFSPLYAFTTICHLSLESTAWSIIISVVS